MNKERKEMWEVGQRVATWHANAVGQMQGSGATQGIPLQAIARLLDTLHDH